MRESSERVRNQWVGRLRFKSVANYPCASLPQLESSPAWRAGSTKPRVGVATCQQECRTYCSAASESMPEASCGQRGGHHHVDATCASRTGYVVQTNSNQPMHGLEKRFNMGWLHGLAGLKPDHVHGEN